jgi:hypothetical protein
METGSGAGESLRAVAFLSPFGTARQATRALSPRRRHVAYADVAVELDVQRYRRASGAVTLCVRARSLRAFSSMTLIRISDSALLATLLADLGERPDLVATVVSPESIRISILGSYNHDALRVATYLRIRAWEAAQHARGVDVHVEID